jgi:hypothetical protein
MGQSEREEGSMKATDLVIPGDRLAYGAENYGFKIVVDEDTAGSYEFDTVLVVRDADGGLWAAHDSGCSCPTPFEDIEWPKDWTAITKPEDIDPVFEDWYSADDNDKAGVRVKLHEALS